MEGQDIISSGILELYAAGAATAEEQAQVEKLRATDPEVKAELDPIERAMEAYAFANAVVPADNVKLQLFAELKISAPVLKSTAKIRSISSWYRTAAAAAILLLIGSAILNFVFYNKYSSADSKLRENEQQLASADFRLQNNEQQLASVTDKVNDMDHDMDIVRSKYSLPVALHGLPAAPDAGAKIFWMKNTGEVYVDPGNLPPTPMGMQYQLWAMVDGKPVDAGMITSPDGKKYKIQKMKSFGAAQAFAITLETAGGNPQPKGKMYVLGNI